MTTHKRQYLARLPYLAAFIVYAVGIWRRDGVLGVALGLLLGLGLIVVVKRRERAHERLEQADRTSVREGLDQ